MQGASASVVGRPDTVAAVDAAGSYGTAALVGLHWRLGKA